MIEDSHSIESLSDYRWSIIYTGNADYLILFSGQTLVSAGSVFELGFFNSSGNSNRLYVGIWYKNIVVRTVVWVANREMPLAANDSGSRLAIGIDGNLRLADGKQNIVWSSDVSIQSNNTLVMLTDAGNLVIKDLVSGALLWESFNNPSNTLLAAMKIGFNTRTGENQSLSSWNTVIDPSPGNFTVSLSVEYPPQGFMWNGSKPYWRSGPWDGWKFQGIPSQDKGYTGGFYVVPNNQQGTVYFTFNTYNSSVIRIMVITPEGSLKILRWEEGNTEWTIDWEAPENPCAIYGVCGPAAVCDINKFPICKCLKGHAPKSSDEWRKGIWDGGCIRQVEFQCEKESNNSDLSRSKNDGFLKLSGMKLPDHYQYIDYEDYSGCKQQCLNNCSCVAYAYPDGIRCMVWTAGFMDLQKFSFGGDDIFLRLSNSEFERTKVKLIAGLTSSAFIILLSIFAYLYCAWKRNQRARKSCRTKDILLGDATLTPRDAREKNSWEDRELSTESSELQVVDFLKISTATCGFSNANKLGEGGFGPVYRGKLEDGQEIAVKRLSSFSGQGNEEFKNEIVLISKLQHRNLVRLLGFCIHREEKLIIYEYMKNKSLDSFLFDSTKKLQLDWHRRFNIIQGIARGLLYLHRDSCLRVIHRDLKASNILLDYDMNPKISDFGLARTFQATQTLANTKRVVGTYGYMAPEYAMGGSFSEKSDVYSFGVLLLEIVSGRKNIGIHHDEKHLNLIGHAWKLWSENIGLDFIDHSMADSCSPLQVMRCIHIGLLCVQDHAAGRPTMATTVLMLSSETDLPQPKQPTFPFQSLLDSDLRTTQSDHAFSMNEVSISMVEGR